MYDKLPASVIKICVHCSFSSFIVLLFWLQNTKTKMEAKMMVEKEKVRKREKEDTLLG